MDDRKPRPTPASGLFSREELLVAGLRTFLASYAERSAETNQRYTDDQARAEHTHDRQLEEANAELVRRTQKADTELAEANSRLETQHAEQESRTCAAWDSKAAGERERHEARVERVEHKRRETVWLAETILESGRPKPRQAFEALAKRVTAGRTAISEWEVFVDSLWPGRVQRADTPALTEASDPETPDEVEAFEQLVDEAGCVAEALDRAMLPRVFRSGLHFLFVPGLGAAAAAGVGFATGWNDWKVPVAAGVGGLVIAAASAVPMRVRAVQQLRAGVREFSRIAARVRAGAEAVLERGERDRDDALIELVDSCRAEVDRAATDAQDALDSLEAERSSLVTNAELQRSSEEHALSRSNAAARAEIERKVAEYREHAQSAHDAAIAKAAEAKRSATGATERLFQTETDALAAEWSSAAQRFSEEIESIVNAAKRASPAWHDRLTRSWNPPEPGETASHLGALTLDIAAMLSELAIEQNPAAPLPETVRLPVMLDMVERPSLLVESGTGNRDAGLAILQTVLLRILASIPPGRAKLTIIDPIGRGRSFAGLMRLTDHDESLVGARIWTESRHIEQRLADLTEHIENVIQKYLRDDYATIDDYNRVAGEIAEPYRYLVIADFPANFSEDAVARLASVIDAGPRCGVFVVMLSDRAVKQPAGFDFASLRSRAIVLKPRSLTGAPSTAAQFGVVSESLGDLLFTPDAPPGESEAAALLDIIGAEAQAAGRVEVRYRVVAPPDAERWTRSAADELRIPIGRAGATKAQELRLGKGTSQHVLIAGKTGSGKSTLLHVLATAAMLWHDPREVEFYLVDFKKGVEFKPYASGKLPHVRAVAIESDREFGLSVLQRLDTELRRRGDLYRDRGLQSLSQFRERFPDEPMPRSILIIDEFQEFFVEDDRIAQDASLLLDRLVRQGRAFGIHILLASQTLSGAYSLSRSTVGQMAVRIAMMCSETDSYLILSEDNSAARLLTRPGEAIYNNANGLVEGNNPFQVAWLGDDDRDSVLHEIERLATRRSVEFEEPVLFEGNAPAELERNRLLRRAVRERQRPIAPIAWLGEPVSIKDPTGAVMRRRGGANLLVVGQRTETAAAILASAIVSLAVQHDAEGDRAPSFRIVDATPEDDPLAGRFAAALAGLPHDVRPVSWRNAPEAVEECYTELIAREDANRTDGPAIYLVLHGLHWLRSLRRKDDDFSFSTDSEAKMPAADQQLKQVIIDGPRLGIFVLAWCDTTSSLTRALDRSSLAEFGNRVLMQMSANDSSMLIESTTASRLGLHRAVFFDEERGAEEKFRPFGMPTPSEVDRILRPDSSGLQR